MRKLLEISEGYRLFHCLIGTANLYRSFVSEQLLLKPNSSLLDVGCGPGNLLEYLPESVQYCGIDIDSDYIASAKKRFPNRGEFYCCDAAQLSSYNFGHQFDVATAVGVLHHLNDQQVFSFVQAISRHLSPTGRFVSIDPLYFEGQTYISRFITSKDRGQFIRNELEYKNLLSGANFKINQHSIVSGLVRLPYTHIIFQLDNSPTAPSPLAMHSNL